MPLILMCCQARLNDIEGFEGLSSQKLEIFYIFKKPMRIEKFYKRPRSLAFCGVKFMKPKKSGKFWNIHIWKVNKFTYTPWFEAAKENYWKIGRSIRILLLVKKSYMLYRLIFLRFFYALSRLSSFVSLYKFALSITL